MKVILAGAPKTGTKTMVIALRELGYEVYDFLDHYRNHKTDWEQIYSKGGTSEDFRRMFENVDAVTDIPACWYWDEIHKAFPDSKIILTTRSDEDAWLKSVLGQGTAWNSLKCRFVFVFSPSMRRFTAWEKKTICNTLRCNTHMVQLYGKPLLNPTLLRNVFRAHNAHVLMNAPKDKLLVYSVQEGWGPLCKFLGKDVPSRDFPHINVGGNILDDFFDSDPVFKAIYREAVFYAAGLLTALSLYGGYKLAMCSNPFSLVKKFIDHIFAAFKCLKF